MMKGTIKPAFGESAEGYKNRMIKNLQDIQRNQLQSQQRLSGGIPLSGNTGMTPANPGTSSLSDIGTASIKIISPDGRTGTVSKANLPAFINAGWRAQ